MRFVDEFRDAEKARALSAKIASLCEPGRQYKFMEVCGGHTHTIYKHGLEDYLPEGVSLVHGPGGRGSFFDSKAAGADIRMVYSPLDSLKIAKQNPDKHVVFMAIGFETTAPSSAMTVLRA